MKKLLPFFLLLTACSPSSMEEFHREGEAVCREITEELKNVQTREELAKAVPKLKTKFNKLVDLMIDARTFQQESEEAFDPTAVKTKASQALLVELKRVYQIEAGRDNIEKAQREALLKLDAFERKKKLK